MVEEADMKTHVTFFSTSAVLKVDRLIRELEEGKRRSRKRKPPVKQVEYPFKPRSE